MQESELKVLQHIYKLSNGHAGLAFKRKTLIDILDLPKRESEKILDGLTRQRMVHQSFFGSFSLTQLGVAEVEKGTAPHTAIPPREFRLNFPSLSTNKNKVGPPCTACKGSGRSKCGRCGGSGSVTGWKTIMETKTVPRTDYYTDFRGQRHSRTFYDARTTPKQVPDRKPCITCRGAGKTKCTTCGGSGQARS